METREILLKSDKVNVAFERIEGDKIRVPTSTWDDAVVILPHQVLEIAIVGEQVRLVRVDKAVAYLDIDDTGCGRALRPRGVTRCGATVTRDRRVALRR